MTREQTETGQRPKCVFGPVPSRRLGRSLGIDLVPFKTCSYDCIYCQLGRTTRKTCRRQAYVPIDAVIAELQVWLAGDADADYLTFSGSGEPTLNSGIGHLIRWLKAHTDTPVAVLTNGSLLGRARVRRALAPADVLVPSLDAATPDVFRRLNRPHPSVDLGEMLDGLAAMRQEGVGEMWLEVMLVEGINDSLRELEALRQALDGVQPDRVQINTVVRPPAETTVRPVRGNAPKRAQEVLGPEAEVIAPFRSRATAPDEDDGLGRSVVDLLRRRPCTLQDMVDGLAVHPNCIVKHLEKLVAEGLVQCELRRGHRYYWVETPAPGISAPTEHVVSK